MRPDHENLLPRLGLIAALLVGCTLAYGGVFSLIYRLAPSSAFASSNQVAANTAKNANPDANATASGKAAANVPPKKAENNPRTPNPQVDNSKDAEEEIPDWENPPPLPQHMVPGNRIGPGQVPFQPPRRNPFPQGRPPFPDPIFPEGRAVAPPFGGPPVAPRAEDEANAWPGPGNAIPGNAITGDAALPVGPNQGFRDMNPHERIHAIHEEQVRKMQDEQLKRLEEQAKKNPSLRRAVEEQRRHIEEVRRLSNEVRARMEQTPTPQNGQNVQNAAGGPVTIRITPTRNLNTRKIELHLNHLQGKVTFSKDGRKIVVHISEYEMPLKTLQGSLNFLNFKSIDEFNRVIEAVER